MRDPGRIPIILTTLQSVWEKYPDMRLGQLLMNVVEIHELQFVASPVGSKEALPDLFHLEDDRFQELLEKFGATVAPDSYTYDEIIASITTDNTHPDIDFGLPVGREIIDDEFEFKKKFMQIIDEARGDYSVSLKEMLERFENDPNNGIQGFWAVEGVRHKAIIRASSASEAVEKALKSGAVRDWELLDVNFVGSEVPDVYKC